MSDITQHGALMDDVYRYQRLIYDVTRKYYLLGRDHLIEQMEVAPGETVLEIACGTGRNLAKIERIYPEARLFGLDISEQMLATARKKLGASVPLARADACKIDAERLFGLSKFDHVVLSYSLSMIPDWRGALGEAHNLLAHGGQLHIADFGDQSGMPKWFRSGLYLWLAKFHVTPREDLPSFLAEKFDGATVRRLYRGYAYRAIIARKV
ncbi:MAG: class I SAM-dependent methyltransferase [Pseudomonadota bacterium]